MIHLFSNLFLEGGNVINQYYHKQTPFFSLVFLNLFGNFVKEIQKGFFNNFICLVTHQNFYIMALGMHSLSFFRIFRRNKIDLHC